MTLQHFGSPTLPIMKETVERPLIQTPHRPRQQFACAGRRTGTSIEQRDFYLPPREGGINSRKISDHHAKKGKTHTGLRNRERSRNRARRSDVAISECEKCLATVIKQQPESDRCAH